MSSPSMPAAPNYALAAQQTSAGNQNAAIANQIGNMTNQKGVTQYKLDPVTGAQVLGPDGKPISLDSTGVTYDNPYAVKDSQGSIPFDMSSLTQKQRDAYNAGQGLPKDFVKTYDPQQWTQQSTLGGNDRTLYDQSQAAQLGLSGIALKGLDAVKQATDPNDPRYKAIDPSIAVQGGPKNTTGLMISNAGTESFKGGQINSTGLKTGPAITADKVTSSLGPISGTVATSTANNGDKLVTTAGASDKASGLSETGNNASKITTSLGIDPKLLNQATTDALYTANTQYLDPQFTQSQAKLENQLANQGITRGSEAYNNAMLNFNNQKQQAYTDARNQAIGQGTAAAQGMFGMGLQGAQFGNTALGQQFGQNVTAQQLANAATQQNNQNAQVNMGLTNQAYGQQFNQNLQANQYANAAQQQNYGQAQATAQFTNAAQQQQFDQAQANNQNINAAIGQRFNMDLANQEAANQAKQSNFNVNLANANLTNEVQSQLYNQKLQSAQLSNQASNQQLAQNQAIQQNPLNILQALRTGAQLNTANLPAVGVSQPAQLANWQGADFLGAATAKGQYDTSIYNAKMASDAATTSAMIGAGGALLSSDRRLKKNIKRIGTHVLGIGLYTWDYLWGQPFSGVMADEVEQVMPEAVVMHPSGFKMVNYSMLGLL